jgi:outer membrane protein assembly factor BamB
MLAFAAQGSGADWPMDRADAARSAYTPEQLPATMSLRWTARESHPPAPAWPGIERMPFDRAYHVVAAGGRFYYGTSSEGKVMARDAATGRTLWTFFTDAPVRFAPVVWRDRLFVTSDDGFLYCLDAADGRVVWKLRGGPRADMLLGNDRMISRWPARGGPVVAEGVVYFAAGIWPSEGVYLRAVDALTGRRLWCNDSSGAIEIDQPHPGARAVSGAAAQGALAVTGDVLLVPTGRAVPAAFQRSDGSFRYLQLNANRAAGGSEVAAFDRFFVNGGTLFAASDGSLQQILGTEVGRRPQRVTHAYTATVQIALHPRWVVYAIGNRLRAVDRARLLVDREIGGREGPKKTKTLNRPAWTAELSAGPVASLIVAGDWVLAGGKDEVTAVDVRTGQICWRGPAAGTAWSLAVADGRLLASTDRGAIHCFARGDSPPVELPPLARSIPTGEKPVFAEAAEEILRRSGVSQGYCLDWGCGDGRLALELARRTKLRIYAVDAEPANVAAARQMLSAAGLYGVRVTVHQADPGRLPYADFFADLIVSGRSVTEGADAVLPAVPARVQRPCGGVACLGRPGSMRMSVRGPLEGAGDWTHLYAGPANTICSEDVRLRGPLGVLWFRDTDLAMPSRHGRSPSPLVAEGRMFVEGLDAVRAVNIYNGSVFWESPLKGLLGPYHQDHLTGVAATGSNMCLGQDRLFLHTGVRCLSLDVKTGRQVASWEAPRGPDGKPGRWGFLACQDEILFGSVPNEKHVVKESWRAFLGKLDMTELLSESAILFALDARTGSLRWKFAPQHSIRHNTIAIGQGRVYLIDRPTAAIDTPRAEARNVKPDHPAGRLVCLDARSGKLLWENRNEIFGTLLALSEKHGVLLMSYQPTTFQLDSELGGRMAAFRAADGTRLWDEKARYRCRPILNDRTVYAEPGKWDLLTGKRLPFAFSRSYGCGILASSQRLLVYRSATLGYYDLEGSRKTENFGGIRPGCWINAIPAGGLVLLADAASWCTCSYLNQATIALQPAPFQGE